MRWIAFGPLAILVAGLAGAASANTYHDFSNPVSSQSTSVDYGDFTATSSAMFLGISFPSLVSVGPDGLGVAGQVVPGVTLDQQPDQIDGRPAGVTESIALSFTRAVRLVNFTVGLADFDDEYSFSINGGARQTSTLAFNAIDTNFVTRFEIFAIGTVPKDGLKGNDDFTLRAIEVAAVPVPATLGLLGAALASLGLVRRRRA